MRMICCASLLTLLATAASAETCAELSYSRNAIYKRAGYCFKTAAQIRNFGNAGCQYDDVRDVPLSARDRAEVDRLVMDEHFYGCRR